MRGPLPSPADPLGLDETRGLFNLRPERERARPDPTVEDPRTETRCDRQLQLGAT